MKKQRVVGVAWHDAAAHAVWESDPSDTAPPLIWSVGFLWHRPTKREPWWVLLGDSAPEDDLEGGNRRITIPARMVIRVVDLAWVTKDGTLWQETPQTG